MPSRFNRWQIKVDEPQPLGKRERRRVNRNTLAPFDRAARFPVDEEANWQRRWRNMALFDVLFAALVLGWIVVLIVIILRAG
jgi:hypothetical protein